MATEIDRRIVGLGFDNAQFESGVAKSLGTIAKLKDALELKGASIGIDQVQNQLSKFTFNTISKGLDEVTSKFSVWEEIAKGALRTIGSMAVTEGKKIINNLGLKQMQAGWDKYMNVTQSVQTMMSALPDKSIEEITERIEALRWFTDETSYSLTGMTSNIAKFTSAGIDLDTAVDAMMGIATASASAGVSTEMATHAMTGFSKAMGRGYMMSNDWMWIQTSGLANSLPFKQALLEAAAMDKVDKNGQKVAATLKKVADAEGKVSYYAKDGKKWAEVTAENIQASFSTRWLDAESMTTALNTYGKFARKLEAFYVQVGNGANYTTAELLEFLDAFKKTGVDFKVDGIGIQEIAKETGVSVDALVASFKDLAVESDKSVNAFTNAMEAISFRQAIDSLNDALSSQWSKTFELLLGNYEDQKVLWTRLANWLNDIFATSAYARNDLLEEWHYSETGGYKDLMQSFYNLMDAGTKLRDILASIFDDYIPSITVDNLTGIVSSFKSKTDDLVSNLDKISGFLDKVRGGRTTEEEPTTETASEEVDVWQRNYNIMRAKEKGVENSKDFYKEVAEDAIDTASNTILSIKKLADSPLLKEDIVNKTISSLIPDAAATKSIYNSNHNVEQIGKFYDELYEASDKLQLLDGPYINDATGVIQKLIPDFAALGYTYGHGRSYDLLGIEDFYGSLQKVSKFDLNPDIERISKEQLVANKSARDAAHAEERAEEERTLNFWNQLYDLFDGVDSAASILKTTFEELWNSIKTLFAPGKVLVDDFVNLFGALGRRITSIAEKLVGEGKISGFFARFTDSAKGPIETIINLIHELLQSLINLIDPDVDFDGKGAFGNIVGILKEFGGYIWDIVKGVMPILEDVWTRLKTVFDLIIDIFRKFFEGINFDVGTKRIKNLVNIFASIFTLKKLNKITGLTDIIKKFKDAFEGRGLIGGLLSLFLGDKQDKDGADKADKYKDKWYAPLVEWFDGALEGFKGIAKKAEELANRYLNIELIKQLANSILKIAAAMFIIALIPEDKMGNAIGALTLIFAAFGGLIAELKLARFKKEDAAAIAGFAGFFGALAVGILALAGSILLLSFVKPDRLATATVALVGSLMVIMFMLERVSSNMAEDLVSGKKIIAIGLAIAAIGLAMTLAANSLLKLSILNPEKLFVTWFAMILTLGAMVASLAILGSLSKVSGRKIFAAATSLVLVAAAMAIVATAIAGLSLLNAGKTWSAVGELVVALGAISVALLGLTNLTMAADLLATAAALLIVSPAILIFAAALAALSLVPFLSLVGGLGVLVVGLGALAVVANLLIPATLTLVTLSAALVGLGIAAVGVGAGILLAGVGIAAAALGIAAAISIVMNTIGSMLAGLAGAFDWVSEKLSNLWTLSKDQGASTTLAQNYETATNRITKASNESTEKITQNWMDATESGNDFVEKLKAIFGAFSESDMSKYGFVSFDNFELGFTGASAGEHDFLSAITNNFGPLLGQMSLNGENSGLAWLMGFLSNDFTVAYNAVQQAVTTGNQPKGKVGLKELEAGKQSGKNFLKGTQQVLEIKSPSKAMIRIMGYVADGMNLGVEKNDYKVMRAGANLGNALLNSTEDAIAPLSDYDYSVSPSVTPVLDLSRVGARGSNLSFATTLTPTAVSNLQSISADLRTQRDTISSYINDAVSTAINAMRDELTFEAPITLDGRELARGTARFTRSELNTLDRNALRKGGYA